MSIGFGGLAGLLGANQMHWGGEEGGGRLFGNAIGYLLVGI